MKKVPKKAKKNQFWLRREVPRRWEGGEGGFRAAIARSLG